MNTNTASLQENTARTSPLVNINDFGQYLTYSSFQEAVHQIKKISLERIIANEPIPEYHLHPRTQWIARTA